MKNRLAYNIYSFGIISSFIVPITLAIIYNIYVIGLFYSNFDDFFQLANSVAQFVNFSSYLFPVIDRAFQDVSASGGSFNRALLVENIYGIDLLIFFVWYFVFIFPYCLFYQCFIQKYSVNIHGYETLKNQIDIIQKSGWLIFILIFTGVFVSFFGFFGDDKSSMVLNRVKYYDSDLFKWPFFAHVTWLLIFFAIINYVRQWRIRQQLKIFEYVNKNKNNHL